MNGAWPGNRRNASTRRVRRHDRPPRGLLAVGYHHSGCRTDALCRAAASTPPAARTFTSRHYGYTGALPAGWSSGVQAAQQWNGQGAPGDEDSVVDLFSGPGGVEAWAIAAPTKQSLAAYTRTTTRAAAAAHPCPATPQTDQAITIGGEPAQLLNMQCPPGSGFLVEIATTIHDGTAYVFTSQNPTGSGNPSADGAAFRTFLAGIQLQQ